MAKYDQEFYYSIYTRAAVSLTFPELALIYFPRVISSFLHSCWCNHHVWHVSFLMLFISLTSHQKKKSKPNQPKPNNLPKVRVLILHCITAKAIQFYGNDGKLYINGSQIYVDLH